MDGSLLRYILKAHSKVQNEFLYLETGALKIKQIISSQRLMNLQTILKRPDDELTKRVYNCQKKNPSEGDWCQLVTKDMEVLKLEMTEQEIKDESKSSYRTKVKHKVNDFTFSALLQEKKEHNKVKHISYTSFESQNYLKTHLLNNQEVSLLFSLRSRTSKHFKANFPYFIDQMCPMGCAEDDTQEHAMFCDPIHPESSRNPTIVYD